MQHITLSEVKTAALAAYREGRLLAQGGFSGYGYSLKNPNGVTRVCAIGAALNSETLDIIENNDLACDTLIGSPDNLSEFAFDWNPDEYDFLCEIQHRHDCWLKAVNGRKYALGYDKAFLVLIS